MSYDFARWLLIFRIFGILIISCNMTTTTEQTESYLMEAESVREFSSKLYKVVTRDFAGNIISSPLSIHVILSYLSHAAVGNTATEMIDGLSLKDVKRLHIGYKNLLCILNSIQAELYLSNAVFLHDNIKLLTTFATLGKKFYNFTTPNINFGDSIESAKTINDWVKDKTNDKIHNIIQPGDVTDDTRAILINAIYFKGQWRYPFDSQHTKPGVFHISEDTSKRVPTMRNKHHYPHGELPGLQSKFIEIPYTDESLSMVVIMPDSTYDLSSLEENFNWNSIVNAKTSDHEIILHLPKFKIECTLNLNETLRKIGFESMFENVADFSEGFTDTSVKVSKVIQKSFIEVNEEGSEAAAATVFQIRKKRALPLLKEFIIDRPFMIVIRHKTSDVPLFVGSVRDIGISVEKDEL